MKHSVILSDAKALLSLFVLAVLAACASDPGLEEETIAPKPIVSSVKLGDCVEARRRASNDPELDVDTLPKVTRQTPAPLRGMPTAVRAQVAQKGAVIKVDVVVDTLGKADMKTFKVVESSNPWFVENLRTVIPQWRFSSAKLAGCKVRRVYKFSATSKKAS